MKTEFVRYLERLSELYPTIDKASTEIINLQSILNLPKGTEHFLSDIHGEYESFSHVLRNGSGAVRKKIDDVFGHTLGTNDKSELASLIYYPKEKIDYIKSLDKDTENWYKITLYRLIEICKVVSSKYTRSKVRKALPPAYAYVIEELITEKPEVLNRGAYYDGIVNTILEIGAAEKFIIAIAELIQRLVVDHLHIIGDIYDRGSGAHKIMDKLCSYHSLDIQWGNHDILWMGAAVGNPACIATVIRNSIRYGNLDVIEDGYGINMIPLATFAMSVYADDDCSCFEIKNKKHSYETEIELEMKMHKAITVIQFKLEGQLIQNHPEFDMNERCLLDKIDFENSTVTIGENVYKMKDVNFPTIDKENPYKLTEREEDMMNKLYSAFVKCEKLQKHMQLMLKKGGMYKVYNGNLLFHGCVPMNSDGSFKAVNVNGKEYSGKDLYDAYEACVRKVLVSNNKKEKRNKWLIALIVVLAILASPIILGLAFGAIGILIGIVVTLFAIVISIIFTGGACILGGIISVIGSLFILSQVGISTAVLFIGLALISIGIGIIFLWLSIKGFKLIIYGCKKIIEKIKRRGGRDE